MEWKYHPERRGLPRTGSGQGRVLAQPTPERGPADTHLLGNQTEIAVMLFQQAFNLDPLDLFESR
jgi:hypothetical protein